MPPSNLLKINGGPWLTIFEPLIWKLSIFVLFLRMAVLGDDEPTGDPAVQGGQNGLVGPGELRKVPIGGLLRSSDPLGEMGDVTVIGNKNPAHSIALLHLEQELARLHDGRAILLSLS